MKTTTFDKGDSSVEEPSYRLNPVLVDPRQIAKQKQQELRRNTQSELKMIDKERLHGEVTI